MKKPTEKQIEFILKLSKAHDSKPLTYEEILAFDYEEICDKITYLKRRINDRTR